MRWEFNDGGRRAAGFRGMVGDCVCRSIAIVTGKPYGEVYEALNAAASGERMSKNRRGRSSARNGVHKATARKFLARLGYVFVPTMGIGTGCKVHLRDGELPSGRLVVSCSRHLTAVVNGVIQDTYDPSRDGNRCVYGYYVKC